MEVALADLRPEPHLVTPPQPLAEPRADAETPGEAPSAPAAGAPTPETPAAPPAPTMPAPVTLLVCSTCKVADGDAHAGAAGQILFDAVRALPQQPDVDVREVRCLGNCKRSLSAALIRTDGWSYVFGDLQAGSAQDLMTGARLFLTATDGILPWRGRPDGLKRGMVARIPPLTLPPSVP